MDELPMVKIGDASMASPFTIKMPIIRSCVDIVRQGRCTLVTSIQMYQILALNCLISAYSLSVLYLDGVSGVSSICVCDCLVHLSSLSEDSDILADMYSLYCVQSIGHCSYVPR